MCVYGCYALNYLTCLTFCVSIFAVILQVCSQDLHNSTRLRLLQEEAQDRSPLQRLQVSGQVMSLLWLRG